MKHYRYIPIFFLIVFLSGCAEHSYKDKLMQTQVMAKEAKDMAAQAAQEAANAKYIAENAALRAESASNDAALSAEAANAAKEKADRIFNRNSTK